MMDGWIACFFVLFLDLAFARDIPVNAASIVKQIDSCPDEGYFFRREPSSNVIGSGPCYLCFCQNNGTVICWERERDRCDVEKYHHHRVGRNTRFRRSFADIFFRDASRDFFNRSLPQQCKPYESSFSDGCPPADWCIGCTVCDCDANGNWDCHILSFCDGQEKKKKVRKPQRNEINNRVNNKDKRHKKKNTTNKPTAKILKKVVKKSRQNKIKNNLKQAESKIKNENKVQNKPIHNKRIQKVKNSNTEKKKQTILKKTLQPMKLNTNISKRMKSQQNHSKTNKVRKVKAVKRIVATEKLIPMKRTNAKRSFNLTPSSNETIEVGQKIVKRVMNTVHKLIAREINKNNETLAAKLAEKKSCEEKMRDKRTYDELAMYKAKKNSRKHKRRKSFRLEDFIDHDERFKREIFNEAEAKAENVSVIKLPPVFNSVIPLKKVKGEYNNSTIQASDHVTQTFSSAPQSNYYYTYSIKNDLNRTTTMGSIKNKTINNEVNVVINLGIPPESVNNTSSNLEEKNTTATNLPINPDFNDLKFTKWFIVKVKKDDQKKSTNKLLSTLNVRHIYRDLVTTEQTYIKNNLLKIENRAKYHVSKNHKYNLHVIKNRNKLFSYINTPKHKNKTDVTGLHTVLQNMIKEMNRNKTTWHKIKPKAGIIAYLRKFFRSIFSKKNPTNNHNVYGIGKNEDHTLQILCENFGPCNIKRSYKFVLKSKLKQLNKETEMILRSISTIKGLLHLLELPNSDKAHNFSKHSPFQNEIRKLGIVLRDDIDEMNTNLTFTQMTQINYIKKNTQTFAQCVRKFAEILNDVLAIIRPPAVHDITTGYGPIKLNSTTSVRKIKKLLYKYNIVQNNFMKKIYELIDGVESQVTTTERNQNQIKDPKANNNENIIEKHSRKIIENLRRLKNLAQVLSSRRKKRRTKSTDGALEYLLTLMEYLILQNHPHTVPANDGIDILLDAIYSAPAIKPIPKTVVEVGYKTENSRFDSENSEQITEDISESKRTLVEENKEDKLAKKVTIKKQSKETMDDKDEKDDMEDIINKVDDFEKYNYMVRSENIKQETSSNSWEVKPINRKFEGFTARTFFKLFNYTTGFYKTNNNVNNKSWLAEQNIEAQDEVTSKVYYRVFKVSTPISNENSYETTTEYISVPILSSNDDKKIDGISKLENNVDKIKKFEVYYADLEEDGNSNTLLETNNTVADSKYTTDKQTKLTTNTEEATTSSWATQTDITVKSQSNESNSYSQEFKNDDKKFKLDWIEETFDREIREFNQINVSAPTLTPSWKIASTTEAITKATNKYAGNVSSITAEVEDRSRNKNRSPKKSSFEDVIQKKQKTFLNSLDYGTEKPDSEDGDSKENNRLDEGFPAYFL